MSAMWISVEWYWKFIKHLWSFVDSERKIRLQNTLVGIVYSAVVLPNIHHCIQPNKILQYVACPPPSLEVR